MQVIYGGTFDPVHHGHLRLAVELKEQLGVEKIRLVPAYVPPHRDEPGATPDQRLRLLELAIAGEPGLLLDDREVRREGASYTTDTLRQFRDAMGSDEPLAMVVGTDAFAAFDRWRDWDQIPELAHIVVVERPGDPLDPAGVPARLLAERRVDDPSGLRHTAAGRALILAPPLLDISATGIRERIVGGRSPRYLFPDVVWDEIRRLGLYGCPRGRR